MPVNEDEPPIDPPEALASAVPPHGNPAPAGRTVRRNRLTQWLPIAANGGALIGLMLVVVQLQQNRNLMRAQIRHELAMGIVELLNTPAIDGQLPSVLRRGALGEQLTPDEQFQFQLRSNALLRYWENVECYRSEAVLAQSLDGTTVSALCYNLSEAPRPEERNPEYAARLQVVLKRLAFPSEYVASIGVPA
jgi:hypothetical protein